MTIVLPPYADLDAPVLPADALGRVHFIGIGGAGMSGIARILLAQGIAVSGSDAREGTALPVLRALGATVWVGHDAGHLDSADTVVVSSAIRAANPELAAARDRGLRVLPRAAALASVLADHRGVAVAGTHGKTSTTSMLTVAAQHCGADPSFAIGGELNETGSNAHLGSGDLFIAEADESDGSFLLLRTHAAIVTNVEADHLDNYGDLAAVHAGFDRFVDSLRDGGLLVLCADDVGAAALGPRAAERGLRVRSYGESVGADLRLTQLTPAGTRTGYRAHLDGADLGVVDVAVPGRHMALNSAAALLTGIELGLPAAGLIAGLARFGGVHRRFELRGIAAGVRVYDDYAHHPTEVAAQLTAARAVAEPGRLVAVFQPHLFSRTAAFATEFGAALSLADSVVVMEVYGAREDPVPGVTGALVAAAVTLPADRVRYEPSWSAVAAAVADRVGPGDVVVTLGAGDVSMIGPEVLGVLAQRSEERP